MTRPDNPALHRRTESMPGSRTAETHWDTVTTWQRTQPRRFDRTLSVLLLSMLLLLTSTPAGALTAEQWRADIDQLVDSLRTQHPMPAARWVKLGIEASADVLKEQAGNQSDHDMLLDMSALVAKLNDGHTRLTLPIAPAVGLSDAHTPTEAPHDAALELSRFPLLVSPFGDDFYVTRSRTDLAGLLGGRMVEINGTPIAIAAERLRPLAHGDNDGWRSRIVADRLTVPEVLTWAGLGDGEKFEFGIELSGSVETVTLSALADNASEWVSIASRVPVTPHLWSEESTHYDFELMGDSLYLRFDRAGYDRERPPPEFVREMESASAALGIQRLIIDLRRNTGGNASWNLPYLRWIIGHPVFDRWGHLYVLIGRNTFSAASLFVNDLEQHTRVLFVGETTGAPPDHFGDARKIRLDNSGLTVRVSTLHWKNWLAGEFRDGIRPHIVAGPDIEALLGGRDNGLEAALTHQFTSIVDTMQTLFDGGDVNSAAIMAVKAASAPDRTPDLLGALLEAGERELEEQNLTTARYFFLLAETGYSEDPRPFHGLGQVALHEGDIETARAHFETALARYPGFVEAERALDALDESE